ncbi:hypothetical protein CYY_005251 [Polysphondylium violaceum]|uniref:AD domain-containing protein n=1 Tax=Polysphondylium violaceum TaxID=133409 RepID=A0A8J4PWX2_9MYCE|nr:hypothetical protein CYY_005251 [Polysphondylium violaceum]
MEDKYTWVVGLKVKIKTTSNEQFEGEVFNYDQNTTCLTLLSDESTAAVFTHKRTVRILLESSISEVTCIGLPQSKSGGNSLNSSSGSGSSINSSKGGNDSYDLSLPPININSILKRQEDSMRKAHLNASRIGVGVTAEAQEVFNSLIKTLPCTWSGDNIIVLNEVKISSPYNVENCTGPEITRERVKKVLEAERKKMLREKQKGN